MNPRNRRITVIAAAAAIIAVPVLTIALVAVPMQHQVAVNTLTMSSVAGGNAAQTARIQQLQSSQAELANLQSRYEDLAAAMPAKPQIAALLTEIGSISAAENVAITTFSSGGSSAPGSATPSAPTPAATPAATAGTGTASSSEGIEVSGATTIPITLQITGAQSQVRAFVGALQGATRLVRVSAVTISEADTGAYTADITGAAFVLPNSAVSGLTNTDSTTTASH